MDMKYIAKTEQEAAVLTAVLPNAWGTVGPKFEAAGPAIAKCVGTAYGLMVFSPSAALETVLRGFNIGFGDEVIVAAWSDPVDAMTAAAVGAAPVFADICPRTLTLTEETVACRITERTRAVVADLPGGKPCDAKGLQGLCREHGLKLILNLDDRWTAKQEGIPLARYADAAFVNFSRGKAVDLGLGAAVVTDDVENHKLFYAYHNCGRPWGVVESTLSFDAIMGGDLRVAEWQASLLPGRLEKVTEPVTGEAGTPQYPAMHLQPFFRSQYFEKLTGKKLEHAKGDFPVSEEAAERARLAK